MTMCLLMRVCIYMCIFLCAHESHAARALILRLQDHPHGFILIGGHVQYCFIAYPDSIEDIEGDPRCNNVVGWAATTDLATVQGMLSSDFSNVDAYLCITESYEQGKRVCEACCLLHGLRMGCSQRDLATRPCAPSSTTL